MKSVRFAADHFVEITTWDADTKASIDMYLRLNRLGRADWMSDSTNAHTVIEALEKVVDDLDCMVFVLRECASIFGSRSVSAGVE
jgi:hypothetical protein